MYTCHLCFNIFTSISSISPNIALDKGSTICISLIDGLTLLDLSIHSFCFKTMCDSSVFQYAFTNLIWKVQDINSCHNFYEEINNFSFTSATSSAATSSPPSSSESPLRSFPLSDRYLDRLPIEILAVEPTHCRSCGFLIVVCYCAFTLIRFKTYINRM